MDVIISDKFGDLFINSKQRPNSLFAGNIYIFIDKLEYDCMRSMKHCMMQTIFRLLNFIHQI